MIDVHAPHERIAGFQDFLLHLLTITVGLLIALSLEGLVEWRHHVHLVEQARETLNAELAYNNGKLQAALLTAVRERAVADANLAVLRKVQDDPSNKMAQHGSLTVEVGILSLHDTAWKTAEATGALGYMPYEQAQRYAGVYQKQAAFEAAELKIIDDEAAFFGVLQKNNLTGKGKLNAQAASQLAEVCGVLRGHMLFTSLQLKEAAQADDALLHGKPEPEGIHEDLSGG